MYSHEIQLKEPQANSREYSTLKNFSKSLISGVSTYNLEFLKRFINFMSECRICKSYVCVTHVSQVHAESEGSIRSIRDDLWVVVSYRAGA